MSTTAETEDKSEAKSTAKSRGAATRGRVARDVAGVDAIEIKATVADSEIDDALNRYHLTVDNDEQRYVYFFDSPDLTLYKAGMIARARRIVGDRHDSTVKLRPVVPTEVPASWRAFPGFKLEADASESGVTKSASLTMPVAKGLIKQVAAGAKGVAKLFSKEQEGFLSDLGGTQIDYGSLAVLGPLTAHRWQFQHPACPWRITAELWKRDDGDRLMEMSIKAPVEQAAVAIAGFLAFLAEAGAERDREEQAKTRWALEYYADKVHKTD